MVYPSLRGCLICCRVLHCVTVFCSVCVSVCFEYLHEKVRMCVMCTHQIADAQHTTQHCNTIKHIAYIATHCNTLQHTTINCSTLQHTAAHCNTLQHTATHCNALQRTASHCNAHTNTEAWWRCNASLHTVQHTCNTLQHTTATQCNTV